MTGLRNTLSHNYFGESIPIIWKILQNKLDSLENAYRNFYKQSDE